MNRDDRTRTRYDPKTLFGVSRCGAGAIGLLSATDRTQRVLVIYCRGGDVYYKELNAAGARTPRMAAAWVAKVDAGEEVPAPLNRELRRGLGKAIEKIASSLNEDPQTESPDEGERNRRDEERKMSADEERMGKADGKGVPDEAPAYVIVRVEDGGRVREPVMVLTDRDTARHLARMGERLIDDGTSVDVVEVPFEV